MYFVTQILVLLESFIALFKGRPYISIITSIELDTFRLFISKLLTDEREYYSYDTSDTI